MPAYICRTCGTQHEPGDKPPAQCVICDDERQYVPASGQSWTTLEALQKKSANAWRELEADLFEIDTVPKVGIGQRALLVRTPQGNFLWDCTALIDAATVALIEAMGGLRGIAISHPHYYTTYAEWSAAFGGVPVWLHAADRRWIMRNSPAVQLWEGERKEVLPGLTLVRLGGHFPGGTVLHWAAGAEGKGALLAGDVVQVVQDGKSVSFMWSFPNFIPLSAPSIEGIVKALEPYPYDRIHGAFAGRTIWEDGRGVVARSAERYLRMIRGDGSYERQS